MGRVVRGFAVARVLWLILLGIGLWVGCRQSPSAPPPSPETTPTPTTEPVAARATSTPRPAPPPVCQPIPPPAAALDPLPWWNETAFYEIFVRSFYDSDGDGIGDLQGIIERLDYLNDGDPATSDDLGISGIWLMPIMPSPSYHGYDVTDYYAINPDYGNKEDSQRLLAEAHRRGIRLIVDLVLNHTSSQHPWFIDANQNVDSPYRDYYIWADSPPAYKSPWGSQVWHRGDNGTYYGIFWSGMPDLNYNNPAVTTEAEKIVRFWLEEMGVDGLRLDAVKHLIEEGATQENTPETHQWLEQFHAFYKSINPEALTVGEAWSSTAQVAAYTGDEVDIAFEFDTAQAMVQSARLEKKLFVAQAAALDAGTYPPNQFATFLSNHDQERLMSQLAGNLDRARVAASLLLTGPGVPFLYYGEEVGQSGRKPDENIRTPMQWSDEANAGFTSASRPWRAPQRNYADFNVAGESADPASLLNHYRRLLQIRSQHEALRYGDWQQLPVDDGALYAFLRRTGQETLLVLINLGDEAKQGYAFCLPQGNLQEGTATELLAGLAVNQPQLNGQGGFDAYIPLPQIAPYSTAVIELR